MNNFVSPNSDDSDQRSRKRILICILTIRYMHLKSGGIEDNSKIIFNIFPQKHIVCPLIRTVGDCSNEGSQYEFLWRNIEKYP